MTMTKKLIDRLRTNANWLDEEDNDERAIRKSMLEAADTIQLLSEKLNALQTEPCEDAISRQAVLAGLANIAKYKAKSDAQKAMMGRSMFFIERLPSVQPEQRWIPVSKMLPEDLEPVNITWVNHEPEPYYHDIKDKNFVATGIHYRGQWYWYSTTCADYLGEYGSNEIDLVDDAIEILAWMPLPEPFKAESEDKE